MKNETKNSVLLERMNDFNISMNERLDAAREFKKTAVQDLKSVCEVDLHCHSFFSDGFDSPAMRVCEAWRRKMKGLSVIDHDVFDGEIEAIEAGKIFGIEIVPGIEFYTNRSGIEIIGYFPDHTHFKKQLGNDIFTPVIEELRRAKTIQLSAMMARIPECFAKFGLENASLTAEDIELHVRNGISAKGDISVMLWEKYGSFLSENNIAVDVKEVQAKITTKANMIDVPLQTTVDLSPEQVIKRILSYGGVPVLPHPAELRNKEGLSNAQIWETICELASFGLEGIEVDGFRNGTCPECGQQQTDIFDQMRLKWNSLNPDRKPLLRTNGSDNHNQPCEAWLKLGCGKNNNLRPEFGKLDIIHILRERQKLMFNL